MGDPEEFLQAFIERWGIKPDYINEGIIDVFSDGLETIGVIGMNYTREYPMLDYFFLKPTFIGRGLGSVMWKHVLKVATQQGWEIFRFISNIEAEDMYKHLGAKKIGEIESFPGRYVPVMEYKVKKD